MKILLSIIMYSLLIYIPLFASEKTIKINFEVLGAVIAPTKVNQKPWDGSFSISKSFTGMISEMLIPGSGFTMSSITSAISKGAPQGMSAPDIAGYVTVIDTPYPSSTLALATYEKRVKNSYLPNFHTGYYNWPITERTRFRIKLWDIDFSEHDNIAVVEVTTEDIIKAIKNKKPLWINVSKQSMNQLLFIQISASVGLQDGYPRTVGEKW